MKRSLLMLMPFAVSGCTISADYGLPTNAAINHHDAKGSLTEGDLVNDDPLPARWWTLFDDPVLNALEEQALAANTDIRVAGANLLRSAAMTRATMGAADPQVALAASVERARLSGESFLKFETIPMATLGNGGAQISYQVDLFGQIKHRIDAAHTEHEASEALTEAVQITVAAEVARAYVAVCGENEALELAEEALEMQERLVEANRRLNSAGKIGISDLTRAEEMLLQAQSRLPVHRAAIRSGLYRLAYLTGKPPSEYPREVEKCNKLPQLKNAFPMGDAATLLARRPDVRAAERMLRSSMAGVAVAKADLYPHISIGLGGGTAGLLADIGSAMAGHWSLGSMMSWIFPTRAQRAKVDLAKANVAASMADFDGKVLNALQEVETALSWYRERHNRAVDLSHAMEKARELAEHDRKMFRAGKAGLTTDISGQAALIAAKDNARAAHDAVAQSQIDLFLALGGGWDSPEQGRGHHGTGKHDAEGHGADSNSAEGNAAENNGTTNNDKASGH